MSCECGGALRSAEVLAGHRCDACGGVLQGRMLRCDGCGKCSCPSCAVDASHPCCREALAPGGSGYWLCSCTGGDPCARRALCFSHAVEHQRESGHPVLLLPSGVELSRAAVAQADARLRRLARVGPMSRFTSACEVCGWLSTEEVPNVGCCACTSCFCAQCLEEGRGGLECLGRASEGHMLFLESLEMTPFPLGSCNCTLLPAFVATDDAGGLPSRVQEQTPSPQTRESSGAASGLHSRTAGYSSYASDCSGGASQPVVLPSPAALEDACRSRRSSTGSATGESRKLRRLNYDNYASEDPRAIESRPFRPSPLEITSSTGQPLDSEVKERLKNYAASYRDGESSSCSAAEVSSRRLESAASTPPVSGDEAVSQQPTTNWAAGLQKVMAMPSYTPQRLAARELAMFDLIVSFEGAAKKIARTIIVEAGLPAELRTVKGDDKIGGVAGGAKYVHDGIFFKFASDHLGLYGGEDFAGKAAAHEIRGSNAYLAFIASRHAANLSLPLNLPLCLVMDFAGHRIVAESCLPISSATLAYGSNDGGETVRADNEVLNGVMAEAGQFIGLKPHIVGKSNKVRLCAPCDIEGHVGTDGKFYVVDTARVFPPEGNNKLFSGLLIPESDEAKCVSAALDQTCTGQLQVSLPKTGWEKKVLGLLRSTSFDRVRFPGGVVCFLSKPPLGSRQNFVASVLTSRLVSGPAVIVPAGYGSRHLHALIRPELLRSCGVPLSSDAFTLFGSDCEDVHNTDVKAVASRVVTEKIPTLVSELLGHTLIRNGQDVVARMHSHGINLRYLALVLWTIRAKPETKRGHFLMSVIFAEIVTRSVKTLIRSSMRNAHSEAGAADSEAEFSNSTAETVVRFFNMLLWLDECSEIFWKGVVKVLLIAKYSHYSSANSPEHWVWFEQESRIPDIRKLLFRNLCTQCGIVFKMHVQTDRPLTVADVESFSVIVQGRQDLLASSPIWPVGGDDQIDARAELVVHRHKHEVVVRGFGERSLEAAVSHVQLAFLHALLGQEEASYKEMQSASQSWFYAPVELASATLFVLAELPGTSREKRLAYLLRAEILLSCVRSGHLFELLVLDKLVRALWDADLYDVATKYARRFRKLFRINAILPSFADMKSMFGSAVPFAYSVAARRKEDTVFDDAILRWTPVSVERYTWGMPGPELVPTQGEFAQFRRQVELHKSPKYLLSSHQVFTASSADVAPWDFSSSRSLPSSALLFSVPEGMAGKPFSCVVDIHQRRPVSILQELCGVKVVSFAVGGDMRTCFALAETGNVFAWGDNEHGQLGVGCECDRRESPSQLELSRVVKVAAHSSYTLFLTDNGQVYSCGLNHHGQLGLGDQQSRPYPCIVPFLEASCTDIALRGSTALAVVKDGALVQWGAPLVRIFPGDSANDLPVPVRVEQISLCHTVKIVCCESVAVALTKRGHMFLFSTFGSSDCHVLSLRRLEIVDACVLCNGCVALSSSGQCFSFGRKRSGALGTGDFPIPEVHEGRTLKHVLMAPMLSKLEPVRVLGSHGGSGGGTLQTASGDWYAWNPNNCVTEKTPEFIGMRPSVIVCGNSEWMLSSFCPLEPPVPLPKRRCGLREEVRDEILVHPNQGVHTEYEDLFRCTVSSRWGICSWDAVLLFTDEQVQPETLNSVAGGTQFSESRLVESDPVTISCSASLFGSVRAVLYTCTFEPKAPTDPPPNEPVYYRTASSLPFQVVPKRVEFSLSAVATLQKCNRVLRVSWSCSLPGKAHRFSLQVTLGQFSQLVELPKKLSKGTEVDVPLDVPLHTEETGPVMVTVVSSKSVYEIICQPLHMELPSLDDLFSAHGRDSTISVPQPLVRPGQVFTVSWDPALWDVPANVHFGSFRLLSGGIFSNETATSVQAPEGNTGSVQLCAPDEYGDYVVRAVCLSGRFGTGGHFTVVTLRNTPTRLELAHPTSAGEKVQVCFELPGDGPDTSRDFIILYHGADVIASHPVLGSRGTLNLDSMVSYGPGKYELRYISWAPGDTTLQCTATTEVEILSPAAVAPAHTASWAELLRPSGLSEELVARYAALFEENQVDIADHSALTNEILKDVGVSVPGHRLKILKLLGK